MSEHIAEILRKAEEQKLVVERVGNSARRVAVPAEPNWRVEVTVPDDVLEWFISLKDRDSGEELYSDSCDHYQVGAESEAQLQFEMRDAVLGFIDVVRNSELRVGQSNGIRLFGRSFFATPSLEVRIEEGGPWEDVWTMLWPNSSRPTD